MDRRHEARQCAVAVGYTFTEQDIKRFGRMIEMVESRITAWLQVELEEARLFDSEVKEAWEKVVPSIIEGINDGEPWL